MLDIIDYDFGEYLIQTPPRNYGKCTECDIELNDCNISCNDMCRECYDKICTKIRPFPHDDFNFPISRGIEHRRRIFLVGQTVDGFVDIISTVDVDMCFRYAFSSDNSREQFKNYEWNGIEVFDARRNVTRVYTCWDKHIFKNWEYLTIWMCSILNRCEYKWRISRKDFIRE